MKVFIIGGGKIGSSIIDELNDGINDITVLEQSEAKVQKIIEAKDILALCIDGTDFRELKGLEVGKADWVISTTNSDEANLITCFFAKRYGAAHTICQIRKHEYTHSEMERIKEAFGIDMIYSPDMLAADEIYDRLEHAEHLRAVKFKRAMKIIIMGGSKIGIHLARRLVHAHCIVKLIERDRDRCYDLANDLPENINIINGDGTVKELLFEEGINHADAFVSLTGIDEENLLMSVFAQSHNVPKVIAKTDRNSFDKLGDTLGITEIVSPMIITAQAVKEYIDEHDDSDTRRSLLSVRR